MAEHPDDVEEGVQWAPVFEREGNRFIVLSSDFISNTREGAWQIGLGASLVELFLWQAKNVHEQVRIVDGEIPHFPATLGATRIALLSGPMFDDCTDPKHLKKETTDAP